ncbi:MAG: acetylxylan esterase [Verrucomicrobiales bacterium]|nr:acetylxylan esterase [Verrucomicrobiales bacterium]
MQYSAKFNAYVKSSSLASVAAGGDSPPMPRIILLLSLILAVPSTHAAIQIAVDRKDAICSVGDAITFTIDVLAGKKSVDSGEISYVLSDDGFGSIRSGKLELTGKPLEVSGELNRPGFLRCTVTYAPKGQKPARKLAAAAVSPEKIGLSQPVPQDFDQFWKNQKTALAKVPMKAELTEVKGQRVPTFDAQVACLGAPVSGYFAKPKDAKPKSLPIILWVHGAGVRSSSLRNTVTGASKGMLSMNINAHGLPNGKPTEFYREQNAGPLRNYWHAGRENRNTVYFKGMFLRLVRAIDFLTAQPEWDGKTVAVVGHSQGGYQALVAGGLDPRVTFIGTGVPAGCDHSGNVADRIAGWPKIVPLSEGEPDAKILEACRYIDAVNFATRFQGEAIMSVGFIDTVCPPTSCYAAYNALKGTKQVINEPAMGHAAPAPIKNAFMAAVLAHAKRK